MQSNHVFIENLEYTGLFWASFPVHCQDMEKSCINILIDISFCFPHKEESREWVNNAIIFFLYIYSFNRLKRSTWRELV